MKTDFYEVLGVSKDATTEEIKKAYRKKALKCHPDKTVKLPENARKKAEEDFQKINNAHEELTDPNRRQQYNPDASTCFYADEPEETRTYESGSKAFTKSGNNNRVKLTGASKSEFTIHAGDYNNQTLTVTVKLAKNSLDPMLDRLNELVEALNNKAFTLDNKNKPAVINEKYERVANKMNAMYYEIMASMSVLRGDLINHDDMLRALQASQTAIKEAQTDGEFSIHRGFVRNCPILRELCVCIDLIANFFDFLDKKIAKMAFGDKTPVFSNMQEFKYGMFKPIPTTTAHKVDELNTDITWYVNEIEREHKDAISYGCT